MLSRLVRDWSSPRAALDRLADQFRDRLNFFLFGHDDFVERNDVHLVEPSGGGAVAAEGVLEHCLLLGNIGLADQQRLFRGGDLPPRRVATSTMAGGPSRDLLLVILEKFLGGGQGLSF